LTKPNYMFCTPSLAEYLIQKAPLIIGKDVGDLKLKGLMLTGEIGASIPELKKKLEQQKIIRAYVGGEMDLVKEKIWEDNEKAPGNENVRIHALRIIDHNGNACAQFDVCDPVTIELEYSILKAGHNMVVQFSFFDDMGQLLFVSKDNLEAPFKDTTCEKGRYRSRCRIPENFLNEGRVAVTYEIVKVASFLSRSTRSSSSLLTFSSKYTYFFTSSGVRFFANISAFIRATGSCRFISGQTPYAERYPVI